MHKSTLEQLRLLSEKIQEEELSFDIAFMAEALMGENPAGEDPRKRTEREKSASVLLRSMRIQLCLNLISQGYSSCVKEVRQDWDEIMKCLKFLACSEKISGELLSDAADIVLLLDPGKRNDLLAALDFSTRLRIKAPKPLRFPVISCGFSMADYCMETGRTAERAQILANLASLSEERNQANPKAHRVVVTNVLRCTVDTDGGLTCKIGDCSKPYFEGITDRNACAFYWFYAFASLQTGRTEEAVPLFRKCHDLCMEVEGERSWVGARAGMYYCYVQLPTDRSGASEQFLWDALRKTESGFYAGMDGSADFAAAITRAVLLRWKMDRQELRGLLPEIQRLRDYCVSAEPNNVNPLLTVRQAENLLSGYYLEMGDYLQAASHARKALASVPPAYIPAEPTDVLLYSNLLLIFTALHDTDQMEYYVQKLRDISDEIKDDRYTLSRVLLLVNTAEKRLKMEQTAGEKELQYLREFHQSILKAPVEPSASVSENVVYSQWLISLCMDFLDSGTVSRDDLLKFRDIALYFQNRPAIYPFSDAQKVTVSAMLAQVEMQLGSPRALDHLAQCLHDAENIAPSREVSISVLRFAAVVYRHFNRMDEAMAVIDKALSGITAAWHKGTAYLNDHRVSELLMYIQFHFNVCYAIMRTAAQPEALYQRILQFKDLPALVGRERSRLLRLTPVDEVLKGQIFALQNQLAAAEWNDSLNGTNSAQRIAAELEQKETEFAARFPQNLQFTPITFRRVCQKLPENAAIVEYYFVPEESALSGKPGQDGALALDVFVTAKRNGTARLHHLRLGNGQTIVGQTDEFVEILTEPDDISAFGRKSSLGTALYRSLLAPVMPYLEGITDLFIAPDGPLCSLPLEILHGDDGSLLQDRFRVCRIVCGRDILFFVDQTASGSGGFILGDPNYDSERGEHTDSQLRGGEMGLEPVLPLPFSGIEARRIGRRCHGQVYSGDAATKYALEKALPCSIIHLATHGVFDCQLEADPLYASYLVFAGYNRWVSRKTESSHCGNGVLTADEISRMDMRKTELVVLSACESGLGDTSYGGVKGLLSAFSAAGARWVVSHIWQANDFSTPILMDAFYDARLNKGMEVPDALRYAKNYLRTVTIGELRRNGWFDLPDDDRIQAEIRDSVNEMYHWNDREKPFTEEVFWGGFTVHRAR